MTIRRRPVRRAISTSCEADHAAPGRARRCRHLPPTLDRGRPPSSSRQRPTRRLAGSGRRICREPSAGSLRIMARLDKACASVARSLRTSNEWAHGLAFTGGNRNWGGQPCGVRQVTITFGSSKAFDRVLIWGSRDGDVDHAAAFTADRSCGSLSSMGPAASITRARAASEDQLPSFAPGLGDLDERRQAAPPRPGAPSVEARRPRRGPGPRPEWLYEVEAYGVGTNSSGDPTHVQITGGALAVDRPDVGDFAPVVLDGSPKTTTATMSPFGVRDATTPCAARWRVRRSDPHPRPAVGARPSSCPSRGDPAPTRSRR